MRTIQNYATTVALSFSLALVTQVSPGQTLSQALLPESTIRDNATSPSPTTGGEVSSRRIQTQNARYIEPTSGQTGDRQVGNTTDQASVVNAQWLAQPGGTAMVHPAQHQQMQYQQAQLQQAQYQQAQYQQTASVNPYMAGGYDPTQPGYADFQGGNPGSNDELWGRVHRPVRYWAALEYVGLRLQGAWTPPLVTTSPQGTAIANAGVLPNAEVLFGNQKIDGDIRPAGEIRIGYWLVDGQFLALEGHYLASDTTSTHYRAETTAFPGQILAVPFSNNGTEAANLVAFPNFNAGGDRIGSVDVDSQSDYQSAGLLLRHVLWADFERNFRLDMIGGYRFAKLDESLGLRQNYTTPPNGPIGALNTQVFDMFDTENEFHGGEIGLSGQWHRGCWTLDLLGKVALGNNHQVVNINGQTINTIVGQAPSAPIVGGTLTAASNIGRESRDEFAVMPEVGIKLQFQLLSNVRLSAGYRLLYLNEVVRPGDQIDRVIGGGRPIRGFQSTSLWMQAFDGGLIVEF